MDKSLTQITFDFAADHPEKDDTVQPVINALQQKRVPAEELEEKEPAVIVRVKEVKKKKSTRGRRSLKEEAVAEELIGVPPDDILFQKQYYAIGEVAAWFKVNGSLIRYWESEFDILQPRKNRKGDRFFKPQDVKNLQLIYDLLRRRKFTIEGAKTFLKKSKSAEKKFEMIQSLEGIRNFLLQLKASL